MRGCGGEGKTLTRLEFRFAYSRHPLPQGERGKERAAARIHLASQESLSFLLDGRLKPGHDGRVKSR